MKNLRKYSQRTCRQMKVNEAAKRLGKSEQFVRIGLQNERLPFGTAVKVQKKWNYHISDKLFNDYLGKD